jgi:hypothetical protein
VTGLAPILQGASPTGWPGSPNTVAAYRDTCRPLLSLAQNKTGKAPSRLSLADLDATMIAAFLAVPGR